MIFNMVSDVVFYTIMIIVLAFAWYFILVVRKIRKDTELDRIRNNINDRIFENKQKFRTQLSVIKNTAKLEKEYVEKLFADNTISKKDEIELDIDILENEFSKWIENETYYKK